ncbi:Rnf-Nqr domain containing protein [Pseudomonas sp. SWRI99]|uniref:Rnf-Nqr domain containing protein n=1 Tax=Pseudomonas sp. SWRI99 TaxID=2745506 RepID=UPI0016489388|nr:Rnf-Nqr domain containing protein [Pseudomonas sp. SWRI99]MBC3775599.1 NADH:quinone oxidoreductase [Pseudomonas sp. SWRI99]
MNSAATSASALMLVPLLGATGSLGAAFGTTLLFFAVLIGYGVCMSALRSRLTQASAVLASVVLAATITSCAEIIAQRWFLPWYQTSALYAGLIAWQCVVLEHSGFFRYPLAVRCRRCGLFASLMLLLAGLREVIGRGSLGQGLFEHWHGLVVFSEGLHLFTLVPGAFIVLGLLLAARQAMTRPHSVTKETHHL